MNNQSPHREDKSISMFELMEVSRIKNLLEYSDVRSVIRWCKNNHVFILKQGNKKFVNKYEFILSFYKPFIQHLKAEHTNWKELFVSFVNGELKELLNVIEEKSLRKEIKKYQPKTKQELSFLTLIKKL